MFLKGHLVVFKNGKDAFIYNVDEIQDGMVSLRNAISSKKIIVEPEHIREADDLEILLGRRSKP